MSNATLTPAAPVVLELPNMKIKGYTGTLTLSGATGNEIAQILAAMQQAGLEQVAAPAAPTPQAPSGVPMCPVHNRPMKESRKPGGWFCSSKVGDEYCKEKR
jgi:hypothetical protein